MFCVVRSTKKIMAAAGFTASLLLAGFAAQAASGDFMQTGKITSQPIGHYEFCKREARECAITSRDTRALKLTPANWQHIIEVNFRSMNASSR